MKNASVVNWLASEVRLLRKRVELIEVSGKQLAFDNSLAIEISPDAALLENDIEKNDGYEKDSVHGLQEE